MEILLFFLFIEIYHIQYEEYKKNIYKNMQLCSLTMQCKKFLFDFVPKKNNKTNILITKNHTFYSFFTIPKSQKFLLKISYPNYHITKDLKNIQVKLFFRFLLASLILALLAFLFTLYSLKPIRTALRLNEEFIKDILHDFNTPITSMVLNIDMLKLKYQNEPIIQRIEYSLDTILLLQNNLKSFLHQLPSQKNYIQIDKITHNRVNFIKNLYPKINFFFKKENELKAFTNEELLIRILDNLLTNAAKYNYPGGSVTTIIKKTKIYIIDTGKGIKNPQKVLERFYKEQERGIGIGLHIVQKFTNELNIDIIIKSQQKKGTTIILDFAKTLKEKK